MKKLILFALLGLFMLAPAPTEGQILKKIGKKIKRTN